MIGRLLGTTVLSTLVFLVGCSFETPPSITPPTVSSDPVKSGPPPTTKDQVKKALEVAKDDPDKAISILETALKSTPEDREANFLLSVISVVQGEVTSDQAKRIALFHKGIAAFDVIKRTNKELNTAEKGFESRIAFGEARALALEGKSAESFVIVKKLMTSGNEDFESIDSIEDLKSLTTLPEFPAFVDSLYAPKLAAALKEITTELAAARPYPFSFSLRDLDDKPVMLTDYRGKLTIVDLWGTWCPPCRREIPAFVALAKKYKDKGLEIVGINCNEEGSEQEVKKRIGEFIKTYQIEYKCLINDDTVQSKIPDFRAYPTTVFVDPTGKVRLTLVGGESKAKLEAAIITLLGETAKAP